MSEDEYIRATYEAEGRVALLRRMLDDHARGAAHYNPFYFDKQWWDWFQKEASDLRILLERMGVKL